jgi:hypothetical protein
LWEASDRICGKRLKPLLPILISSMEQHGHLKLDDQVRTLLLQMSAATIDRALNFTVQIAPEKRQRILGLIQTRISRPILSKRYRVPCTSLPTFIAGIAGMPAGTWLNTAPSLPGEHFLIDTFGDVVERTAMNPRYVIDSFFSPKAKSEWLLPILLALSCA